MKKRAAILFAFFSIFFCFFVFSCGEVTAYSLVSDAVAKTAALDSFDAEISVSAGNVPMSYRIKAAGLAGGGQDTSASMAVTAESAGRETAAYIENGWCYLSALEQKIKAEEDAAYFDGYFMAEALLKKLPKRLFVSDAVTENKDGTRTVRVTVPEREFGEIYRDLVETLSASAAQEGAISEASAACGEVEITIDGNGYVSVYKVSFETDGKAESDGASADDKASAEIKIEFRSPGTPVTVEPPAGYRNFQEMDSYEAVLHALVTNAAGKTLALDSYDAVMDISMGLDVMGTRISMPMEYRIKTAGLAGTSPVRSETEIVTLLGTMTKTEAYTEGDWYYLRFISSAGGDAETMKIRLDENVSRKDFPDVSYVIKTPGKELFSGAWIAEGDDGSRTVFFSVPGDAFADVYEGLVDELSSSAAQGIFAQGGEISDLSITGAEVKITVDRNGYISDYGIRFDLGMTVKYQNLSVDTALSLDLALLLKDPGTEATVTPPDGYLDYEEYAAPPGFYA